MRGGSAAHAVEILTFELAGRLYALPAADVIELLRSVAATSLPKAPAVVEGVIDLRGRICPVLDIRARFGLPPKGAELTDHLVIARAGERVVAIRADRVLGLHAVDAHEVAEAARIVPGAEYVAGVARLPDGLALIHDLRTFLTHAEGLALDEAIASARDRAER